MSAAGRYRDLLTVTTTAAVIGQAAGCQPLSPVGSLWFHEGMRRLHAQIGARVTAAHLAHFCPGGLGLPVTTLRPAGLSQHEAALLIPDGSGARAVGEPCERCGRPIAPGQDARRRISRNWVHETCPALAGCLGGG
jgi:hypothetical protein